MRVHVRGNPWQKTKNVFSEYRMTCANHSRAPLNRTTEFPAGSSTMGTIKATHGHHSFSLLNRR
jgi:hypothetical protein